MKWKKEAITIILLVAVVMTPFVSAEEIKTPNNCDFCPGTIYYGADEAKIILGQDGQSLLSKLNRFERKTVKIDPDAVLRNGSEKDTDKGYEIKIYGYPDIIYIEAINDGSYIMIVTDYYNPQRSGALDKWHPEIALQAKKAENINLDDSVKLAWKKMKKSTIYQWITSGADDADWNTLLKEKVLQAIRLMVG